MTFPFGVIMATGLDTEKEKAILETLRPISAALGKRQEYDDLVRMHDTWLQFLTLKDYDVEKEYEETVSHFPTWAKESFTAIRTLYQKAYEKGRMDATHQAG